MTIVGRKRALGCAVALASLFVSAACAEDTDGGLDLPDLSGETIAVAAVWGGDEQDAFEKVMKRFEQGTGAQVAYSTTGNDIATVLNSKLDIDAAPDIAFLPQPGLMHGYAESGDIEPLSQDTVSTIEEHYAQVWTDLGSYADDTYGVWFDVSNKSTVWYNVPVFDKVGVDPPETWDELIQGAQKLKEAGVDTPIALAAADGWILTDWFENLYIQIAGVEKYDQLTKHEIAWTDQSVVDTLELLGNLFANEELVGKPKNALEVDFPTAVQNVFQKSPDSAIFFEGSFVGGEIAETEDYEVGKGADWFKFPTVDDAPESVVGGGDVAVQFNNDEATEAFMTYLASPHAAADMVSTGHFSSANKSMDRQAYPNDTSRELGEAIVEAGNNFRFDMSDMAPAEFGATIGSGEWKILQDFLKDPSDPEKTAEQLEKAANQAYD